MATECTVCVSTYNQRSPCVTCYKCEYSACRSCVVKYITERNFLPKCMQCNEIWNHEFISNMGGTISKRLFDHRAGVEVTKQKALLPSMMQFIRMEERINEYQEEIKLQEEILKKERQKYTLMMDKRIAMTRQLQTEIRAYVLPNQASTSSKAKFVKSEYIGPCSQEDCRGFIFRDKSECGLCKTKYCGKCHDVLTDDHACNPDTVASIKMMQESSKPCPNCCVHIHKISGCNDMFCVSCKTTFCWRTGKIHENGNSNPLYYNWLRESPNNVRQARGRLSVFLRSDVYRAIPPAPRGLISSVLQEMDHVITVLNQRMEKFSEEETALRMHELRMEFIKNIISESKFKTTVKRMHTDKEHITMLSEAIPLANSIREHIFDSIVRIGFENGIDTVITEVKEMISNLNTKHQAIGNIFGRVPYCTYEIVNDKLRRV